MLTVMDWERQPMALITRHKFTNMQHLYRVKNGKITRTKYESEDPQAFEKYYMKWGGITSGMDPET